MAIGYTSLAGPGQARIEIKKSQFIGLVEPVSTVQAAEAVVATQRKAHHGARHHCTALILRQPGPLQRSNDDGEPAGSAGAPMLAVLRQGGLSDVVAVVSRFFGGTLLGVSGLARAYSQAVAEALAETTTVTYEPASHLRLSLPHGLAGDFDHSVRQWLAAHRSYLGSVTYDAEVAFSILVANSEQTDFDHFLAPWLARDLKLVEATPDWLAIPGDGLRPGSSDSTRPK